MTATKSAWEEKVGQGLSYPLGVRKGQVQKKFSLFIPNDVPVVTIDGIERSVALTLTYSVNELLHKYQREEVRIILVGDQVELATNLGVPSIESDEEVEALFDAVRAITEDRVLEFEQCLVRSFEDYHRSVQDGEKLERLVFVVWGKQPSAAKEQLVQYLERMGRSMGYTLIATKNHAKHVSGMIQLEAGQDQVSANYMDRHVECELPINY